MNCRQRSCVGLPPLGVSPHLFFVTLGEPYATGHYAALSIYCITNVFCCQTILDKLIMHYLKFKGAEYIAALPSFRQHSTTWTRGLLRVATG